MEPQTIFLNIGDYKVSKFATYRAKSYSGGLNNSGSRRDIERNQASLIENWDLHLKGRLITRVGLTQVGDTLSNVAKSLGVYRSKTGTNTLMCTEGTDIRYLNGSTWTDVGNLSAAEPVSFANVAVSDKVYFGSENNALQTFDGSTVAAVGGTSIAGNVMMWYQNHMFHINNVNVSSTKYPHRVYWSDFGNPAAYTTASSFVELPGEGRAITMNVLGSSLVLFKADSYMFMSGYGSSSWALSATSTSISNSDASVGCVAPRGTVRVGANELWFIDNQGYIRRLTQADYGYESKVMSDNLDPSKITVNGIVVGLDLGKLSNAIAWYDDNKVYFAVTANGSTVNNVLLVYDKAASADNSNQEAWTTYTGWTIIDMLSYGNGTNPLLYISSNDKKIYKHLGGDDAGTAITARWDGKNDDYDQPERYKKYTYGYLFSQAQFDEDVTIHSSVDGLGFGQIGTFNLMNDGTRLGPTGPATMGPTGTFILGGSADKVKKYYYSDGGGTITGKTVTMSIRTVTNNTIYVDTFTNHFVVRSLK